MPGPVALSNILVLIGSGHLEQQHVTWKSAGEILHEWKSHLNEWKEIRIQHLTGSFWPYKLIKK